MKTPFWTRLFLFLLILKSLDIFAITASKTSFCSTANQTEANIGFHDFVSSKNLKKQLTQKMNKQTLSSESEQSQNKKTGFSIGFCGLLTITFVVLKALGYLSFSWLWVFSPLWIPFAFCLLLGIILAAFGLLD